ncbi:MAG: peptidase [Polyangia bacterium]|nr:peptidase [Polyangia bacterium]
MFKTNRGILWAFSCFFCLAGCKDKPTDDPAARAPEGPARPAPMETDARPPAPTPKARTETMKVVPDIKDRLRAFAPTKIDYDEALVTPELKPVLAKLIAAAKIMDELFFVQAWEKNPEHRAKLAEAARGDARLAEALAYYDIMYGPWDRREHHAPFVGDIKRPPGAGFYPEDMTKEELAEHLKKNPKDKEAFTGYFSVIRRKPDRTLEAIPYSVFYKEKLGAAGKLLLEAADLSKDPRLQKYLRSRAKAFETNEYRESDMAWMDLGDGAVEAVIGPYEVYEDSLFGYKAAFEAFITLRDPKYSERLAKIAPHIPFLQASLPMKDEDKKHQRGKQVPISVVVQLFTAGDTRAGVQTLAFNLPNDEEVRKQKGYKLVLLKNVAEAKFEKILLPIARKMIAPEQLPLVTFDAFFTNTLTHESAHGLGPGLITVLQDGKPVQTDVNKALKELYSTIEEAKADIVGLYTAPLLIQKGALPAALSRQVYASYLAGFFRSVRFGASEAHGRANLISFNYLREKGGIAFDQRTGLYRVDFAKIAGAVGDLARDLLELEARGDYAKAKAFIARYGEMSPEMTEALKRLTDVPVDIRPEYQVLTRMQSW